jgi:hypothetical protein
MQRKTKRLASLSKVASVGFFGQLSPSLSHFVQDHALPLRLGLFS